MFICRVEEYGSYPTMLGRLGAPDSKSYLAKTSRVPIKGSQPDKRFALVRYARRNPLFGI